MAGGVGSRFWPMSTQHKPKQFLDVLGIGKSLLRLTFERMQKISSNDQIYILTNASYLALVLEQLPELNESQVICEPERKNTAPCIAFAAAKILQLDPEASLLISPSDHLIINTERFTHLVNVALEEAKKGQLVTLGIQPSRPDTGYGYIEFDAIKNMPGEVHKVQQFCEKPNLATAKEFLASGNYVWNSGIFIWKAKTILEAISTFQPDLYQIFCGQFSKYNCSEEPLFLKESFALCTDISIDFAVMEHAKNVSVVLSDFDWSDLGTWGSLVDHMELDDKKNAIVGKNIHLFDTQNCLIHMPEDKVVLLDGIKDTIIVESDGMLMILRKDREQDLKLYLKQMELSNPDLFK